MKLFLFALLISIVNCNSSVQTSNISENTVEQNEESEQEEILVGAISMEDLRQEPHATWFEPMYKSYKPSEEALATIKNNISDYEITVFMGTWCADSQREVPKLYKLLEESGYNMENFEMQAVKEDKTLPGELEKEYNIHYVPTIIFSKNGKEVNRFVEYPQEDFEDDLAKIVSGQEYSNSYE